MVSPKCNGLSARSSKRLSFTGTAADCSRLSVRLLQHQTAFLQDGQTIAYQCGAHHRLGYLSNRQYMSCFSKC